jgi:hypothetical protein
MTGILRKTASCGIFAKFRRLILAIIGIEGAGLFQAHWGRVSSLIADGGFHDQVVAIAFDSPAGIVRPLDCVRIGNGDSPRRRLHIV